MPQEWKLTYFEEKLQEARSNQMGSLVIIIIGVLLIGLYFSLPQCVSLFFEPAILTIGLIIEMIGVLELSYHLKEYSGYHTLMEQLKTTDF